jgi:branched-chain amino acid transport system substrate-binding protein
MVAQRINVPSRLDGIAVGAGAVWAVSGVSATALRLDPRGRVTLPIPIVSRPGFESPYPLEVSVGEGYVWVLNANTATVTKIDPGQRTVLATIPIGIDHGPLRLAVGSGAAWVANRDGTLTRIDPTTDAPTFIPVGHGLRDVAVAAGSVWVTVGTGLSGATGASTEVGRGRVRPLPSSSCSPIYYGSSGQPRYLIASDLPLQGSGSRTPQLAQAIQYVLKQHAFHAGRYAVGYQSCDDSTAPAGHWSAARCAANAHAYADDRSVIGVIGTFNSPCSQIEVPVLNRAALAIVSPANTYVGLTHSGPGSARNEPARYYPTGVRNYVRVVAADDVQGAADALLARQLGVRRVYVLHDDEPYGAGIAAAFRSAAVRLGIRIVGDSGWILSADSYVKVAGRVALSRPDGVFLGGLGVPGTNGGALVNDLRSTLPASVRIMAPDGFSLDWLVAAIGSAAEGMTASEPSVANERLPPQGRKFLAAFGKAVGEQPVQSSADAAQAAQILLDAIARSNGTRASVIAELFKTKVSNGILGSFAIDPNGDTTAAAVTIYKVVHAKPTVYKVITPPRSLVEAR